MKNKEEDKMEMSTEQEEVKPGSKGINRRFAKDWVNHHAVGQDSLQRYLLDEIKSTLENGYLVLSSILAHPSEMIKTESLIVLKRQTRGRGNLKELSNVYLKLISKDLRPGELPIHDYNGCKLPANKRGKILAVKVGFAGEFEDPELNDPKMQEVKHTKYSRENFVSNARTAADEYGFEDAPYVCKEVGESPVAFGISEAVGILRRYGHKIAKKKQLAFLEEVYI